MATAKKTAAPKKPTKAELAEQHREAVMAKARKELKKLLPRKSRVYVIVKKVNRMGDARTMQVLIPKKWPNHGQQKGYLAIEDITHRVAEAFDMKRDGDGDLWVHGCGMDMTYWLVDRIARGLHGDGNALEKHNL